MGLFSLNEFQILLFFAALVRVGCMFLLVPFFSDSTIPGPAKILLAFSLTLILFPIIQSRAFMLPPDTFETNMGIVTVVAKEAAVGLALGFVAKLFYEALSIAFGYMGMQMGFNMASLYDHHTETNTPVVSQFAMVLAMLIFLAMDGHHMIIKAAAESFELVPVGKMVFTKMISNYMLDIMDRVFWITVKLSAPMALVIFLLNVSFGIIAKAVPQINVLVVSFTVNILAGFLVLSLTMPVFGLSVADVFQEMVLRMGHLLKFLV